MWVRSGVLLLLMCVNGLGSTAESISIYPTTLILENNTGIGTLTIENRSDHTATYEFAGYQWTQSDKGDELALDKSFVISPPVVSLQPGEAKIVRMGLLSSARSTTETEKSYRLRISELSSPATISNANLKVKLQLLLPVFSGAPNTDQDLELSAVKRADGQTCIEGSNHASSHTKLIWLSRSAPSSDKTPVQKYILADSHGTLCTDANYNVGDKLTVGTSTAYRNEIRPYEITVLAP
ncbi:MAG: fimbria/pilus periplasmic chaperone [Hyphomonas sp.]